MTAHDQLHAQMAYIKLIEALRDVEQIRDKDVMMTNVQLTLYHLKDVIQGYIGPVGRG